MFIERQSTVDHHTDMYPENPEGTQVIVGSINMGYMSMSDTARNRISKKGISHPSLQLSIVLRVLYIFDFQWRPTTSISRYFVPLQVKSRLLWIPRQPRETRSRRNMVMFVSSDQSHYIFLSNHAQQLKPRLDEEWVCQTLFMWIIFFKIVTLNLSVVNSNQLESVVTWYVLQYTNSYMSDYSWSLRKKSSLSDRLSTLDCWMYLKLCGCCYPFLACFVLQWLIQIPEIP